MDTVMCEDISDEIAHQGRHSADEVVLSIFSPTTDQVIGFGIGQQRQNVPAVLLKVSVSVDNELAVAVLEPGIECGGLPVVTLKVESFYFVILSSKSIHDFTAPVGTAVVDENNFKWTSLRGGMHTHDREQTLDERRKILALILYRDNDSSPWAWCISHERPTGSISAVQRRVRGRILLKAWTKVNRGVMRQSKSDRIST